MDRSIERNVIEYNVQYLMTSKEVESPFRLKEIFILNLQKTMITSWFDLSVLEDDSLFFKKLPK